MFQRVITTLSTPVLRAKLKDQVLVFVVALGVALAAGAIASVVANL